MSETPRLKSIEVVGLKRQALHGAAESPQPHTKPRGRSRGNTSLPQRF